MPASDRRSNAAPLALLGGLLTTLSVPPFGWWPLAFVGIAVLCAAVARVPDGPRGRARFLLGLSFGAGLYVPSLWWMAQFSLPGAIFVGVLESTITGLCLVALPRARTSALVPAGLVLADAMRSLWPFGGLPLGGIDLGQADGPLAPSVAFGGRLLLVALTALAGMLVFEAARLVRSTPRNRISLHRILAGAAVLGIVVMAVHVLPDGTHADGRTIRVAIAQGGGPRGQRASVDNARRTYEAHLAATRSLQPADDLDLVLWPENTVDVHELASSKEAEELTVEAQRLGAPIVVGITADLDDRHGFNAQAVIEPSGVGDVFEKVRRVPYGEYFPFRSLIERYDLAPIPHRDFRAGHGPGVITAGGVRFAIAISYEGFFDDRTRGGVRGGGRAVLIPTNASSYLTMQVPTQQLAAARLRARETGRWVVQAAPTGLSAFLTPSAGVVWRSAIGERQTHVHAIELRHGLTPYARWNDGPVLVLLALALGATWADALQRRSRASARNSPSGS